MGKQLTADYAGSEPIVIGILRGAAMFHADLIRSLELPITIDFLSVASYGNNTQTSGEVHFLKDLETTVEGKDLLLVEDIVDTGLTLDFLVRTMLARNPKSIRVCSFLSKPSRRQVEVHVDYIGFEIPDEFVVGYGLDFAQKYRNLPYLAVLKGED